MKKPSAYDLVIIILVVIIFTFSGHLNAEDNAEKNDKKWNSLMGLINQEIQTIKGTKASGPELRHRLFELYSEKIKLIKEKENALFLKADPKRVAEKGKDYFFKLSLEQFTVSQNFGLNIIKEYPKYAKNNEIYYALAVNSRDFGTGKDTEKYLLLSLKSGTNNPQIAFNAKVGLAEYNYNEKRYHEANFYYEDVLKVKNDEWYAKHLYNSSWCHLKERNFKKALDLIKESYSVAVLKQNEAMRTLIINAIGIFYVQADATMEGVDFFLKNTSPSSGYLFSLAKSSRSKNNFSLTNNVFKIALDYTLKEKNIEQEMKVRLELLELYREHKKTDLFILEASNIATIHKNRKLSNDDVLAVSNKIKELAGFMQINLVKDKLQEKVSYDREDYNNIIKLFNLLALIDQENKSLYRYYQGETAFSVQDFKGANRYYIRAISIIKKTHKTSSQTIKTIDSLLVSLEQAKLSKNTEERWTIFALKNYIIFYPKSDRSQKIYQKLFSKYMVLKQYKRAANIMLVYHDQYQADETIHKEMLTQILDAYIKSKNTEQLTTWVNIIDKGFLHFPTDFIQNSIIVLGDLLFENYQSLEKNKHLKEARAGYETIYDSKFYPVKIKSEAAYSMASAFLQENKSSESLKWFKKSLEIYPPKDLIKTTGNIYNLASGHRLLQNLDNSNEIAILTLKKFCQEEFVKKDDFFELIIYNTLLENDSISDIVSLEREYSKCKISETKLTQIQNEIISTLIAGDKFKNILKYINNRELNPNSIKMVNAYLQFKFWRSPKELLETMQDLSAKKPELNLEKTLSEYDQLLAYKEKVKNLKFVFSSEEKFNDEKYNNELEQYLSIVTELTNLAINLAKNAPLEVVVELQEIISTPYKSLQNAILSYRPRGVDDNYLKGFFQGMRQISESLSAKILQFDREKVAFFGKNHFFYQINNHATLGNEKLNIDQALDFHSALLHSQAIELSGEKK